MKLFTPLIRGTLFSVAVGLIIVSANAQTPAPAAATKPASAAKPAPSTAVAPSPLAAAIPAPAVAPAPAPGPATITTTTTGGGTTTTITISITTGATAPALDFGDAKSSTLIGKAWDAFNDKNYADAEGYANKCIELYQTQALEMQSGLKAKPDKDAAGNMWALNDVGTGYYIVGKSLEKKHDKKGAIDAYTFLVSKLSFAQSWDPGGWYWTPADAADKSLTELK
jgi:hypothetical protein